MSKCKVPPKVHFYFRFTQVLKLYTLFFLMTVREKAQRSQHIFIPLKYTFPKWSFLHRKRKKKLFFTLPLHNSENIFNFSKKSESNDRNQKKAAWRIIQQHKNARIDNVPIFFLQLFPEIYFLKKQKRTTEKK